MYFPPLSAVEWVHLLEPQETDVVGGRINDGPLTRSYSVGQLVEPRSVPVRAEYGTAIFRNCISHCFCLTLFYPYHLVCILNAK